MKTETAKITPATKTAPPFFIVGPTAVGKSALAFALAKKLGAEVVSVDAFQIYKGMDIGTGKPSSKERREIPHHLIDLIDPASSFSVADYLRHAMSARDDLQGKLSIWVGGTGLYFRALKEGLCPAPASDPVVLEQLQSVPLHQLVRQIRQVDPEWVAKADLHNRRRVMRALAVYLQTGEKFSIWQKKHVEPVFEKGITFCLMPNIDELREKITQRVRSMWEAGWPEEVKRLYELPRWETGQSIAAVGYRRVLSYLKGEMGPETCIKMIAVETGQLAKRQLTWFRSEVDAVPISVSKEDLRSPEKLIPKITEYLRYWC